MFNPMPTRGKNGTIAWLDTNESDRRSPLRVGQTLGVSLHSISIVQPNEWSLMGEALFTLDANGRIRVQDRIGEAVEPAPTGLEGMTLDTLEDALRACDAASPTADARRTLVHNLWGPKGRSPAHYRAAVCHATVDTPHAPGACHVDSDCLDGERCQNATCVRVKD